ncbi:MAG: M24 family metallopeptidase [Bryobacteraceae bacterium]
MSTNRVMSRRMILRGASAAGASLALAGASSGSQGDEHMAPSIASLKSMRDRAKPITVKERQQRIQKARQLMAANKIDAILLVGGTSQLYFTGMNWGGSERLLATVVPQSGKAFVVCPAFEEDRAREQLNRGPLEDATVMTWQEDESPYRLVASGLKALGKSGGTIGIEERTPWVFSEGIAKAAPGVRLTSATPVTAGCRTIKSPHELELMQIANEATLKVYQAVYHALKPGMTQTEASSLISAGYAKVGFPGEASVEVGPYTANPHGSATPQVIRENTIIMIDDGCTAEGYNSDITRTFVLGKPTDKMKKVFDIVRRAQQAALAAAKPGVECQAVDAAARKVVEDAGFGPNYNFFTHRVGHGIGMDIHEWPYLVRGNTLKLQPNMTFSDEPGIYIRNEFGVRIEDDMHITESGAELFTHPGASLEHPFA